MTGKTEEQLNGILNKVTDAMRYRDDTSDCNIDTSEHQELLLKADTLVDWDQSIHVIQGPKVKSRLSMHNDAIVCEFIDRPRPNWWFRIWYRLLLGWRWFDK